MSAGKPAFRISPFVMSPSYTVNVNCSGSINNGSASFTNIGCAVCHIATMRTGNHTTGALRNQPVNLFSDLLVRDGISQGLAGGKMNSVPLLSGAVASASFFFTTENQRSYDRHPSLCRRRRRPGFGSKSRGAASSWRSPALTSPAARSPFSRRHPRSARSK
jgi:hypothetical protein